MTRINSDSSTTAAGQEAEFKIVSLEKRVEVLSTEIEKYNTTLITKNKEICELKSQKYEVEKLTEILHNKSSELTNLKANYHILEKKYIQA
jgi:predicted RNase H-like nuclease (RuvC/YqgF family)